jgi:hypothetical protein
MAKFKFNAPAYFFEDGSRRPFKEPFLRPPQLMLTHRASTHLFYRFERYMLAWPAPASRPHHYTIGLYKPDTKQYVAHSDTIDITLWRVPPPCSEYASTKYATEVMLNERLANEVASEGYTTQELVVCLN